MDLNLQVQNNEEYLLAKISGVFSFQSWSKVFTKLLNECIEYKPERVIADVSDLIFETPMELMDRYDTAKMMAEKFLEYKKKGLIPFRIVFLGTDAQINPDGFAETVSQNRGLNFKATTNKSEAFAWLGLEETVKQNN